MKELNGEYINDDWRNVLPSFPDNHFAIAIVDPPYFLGPDKRGNYGKEVSTHLNVKRGRYPQMNWQGEIPGHVYYEELCRVSKHQIIWGINYFEFAGSVSGRIIWDKVNQSTTYSDCEIASCSIHYSTRIFRYMWNGMMQGKSIKEGWIQQGNKKLNEKRIHSTQKPVNLYKWLVMNYTNKGDKILDTHVGSASSLIAYESANLQYVGIEKDEEVFNVSMARLSSFVESQVLKLF